MKLFGVVYLIWNMVNGKKYVGQSVQPLNKRMTQHKCNDQVVDRAIKKHGWDNFRCGIIKSCTSKSELDHWEKFYIAALRSKFPHGYNLTDGGEGIVGLKRTPEHCAKLSASKKGKKLSIETRAKMSAIRKGKPRSPEHCAKLSAALKGKIFTPERCANISAALKGKKYPPRSPEYRAKISAIHKGRPRSSEHCAKLSAAKRDDSSYKNLIAELDAHQLSYRQLSKLLGLSQGCVSRKMRGVRKFTACDKIKLEEIFGKPVEYLLERDDD